MSDSRYVFTALDQLFHVPARLGISTALYARSSGMTFSELKRACDLSDGNLSRHLGKLQDSGVVIAEKRFVDRTPQTTVRLTPEGRSRFESYMESLRTIVQNHEPRESATEKPGRDGLVYE